MADRYWEYYDDQSSEDFDEISYVDLQGALIVVKTQPDLERQVAEIRRRCGADTEIKVYAKEGACLV